MDGDLHAELLAELLDDAEGGRLRLGDEGVGAHLLGELEYLAALGFIRGQLDDAPVDDPLDAGAGELLLDGAEVGGGDAGGRRWLLAVEVHAAGEAHILEAEAGGLVYRVVDLELLEGVGVDGQLPAELVGGGFVGGISAANQQGKHEGAKQLFHGVTVLSRHQFAQRLRHARRQRHDSFRATRRPQFEHDSLDQFGNVRTTTACAAAWPADDHDFTAL